MTFLTRPSTYLDLYVCLLLSLRPTYHTYKYYIWPSYMCGKGPSKSLKNLQRVLLLRRDRGKRMVKSDFLHLRLNLSVLSFLVEDSKPQETLRSFTPCILHLTLGRLRSLVSPWPIQKKESFPSLYLKNLLYAKSGTRFCAIQTIPPFTTSRSNSPLHWKLLIRRHSK